MRCRKRKKTDPKKGDQPDNRLGLPQLHMVYKDANRGSLTWDSLEEKNIPMTREEVVYPLVEGDTLSAVYINMDSNVLLSHRAKLKKAEAIATADNRYVSAVYFHTLFLYTITKNRKYGIVQQKGEEVDPGRRRRHRLHIGPVQDLLRAVPPEFRHATADRRAGGVRRPRGK